MGEDRLALHWVASGGLYGIERVLLALLPALEGAGWRAELACFVHQTGAGREVGEAFQAIGGRAHFIDVGGAGYLPGVAKMFGLLRRRSPPIVHVHGYKASILAGAAGLLNRRSVVATYHGEARRAHGLKWQHSVEDHVLRRFRKVIAVSEPIRRELILRGVNDERIHVVSNAAADPGWRRYPPQRESHRIVTAGRLVPGKRMDLVIEAVARLRREGLQASLDVLGDGPLARDLRAQAARLGVAEYVTFHGFVNDVTDVLANGDCFVLASDTEGMPMVVLEAMALGVPVVATAVGSLPVLAEGGRNLLLIPPGDDPEPLTVALDRILQAPDLASSLSENAREKYERDHIPSAMAAKYAEIYSLAE